MSSQPNGLRPSEKQPGVVVWPMVDFEADDVFVEHKGVVVNLGHEKNASLQAAALCNTHVQNGVNQRAQFEIRVERFRKFNQLLLAVDLALVVLDERVGLV